MRISSILAFATVVAMGACGTSVDSDDAGTSSISQSVATYSTYWNGVGSLPVPPGGGFCHPTMISGSGAHSQAQILNWGIPASGGIAAINSNTASAVPNQFRGTPRSGTMMLTLMCNQYSDFHPTGPGGNSDQWVFAYGEQQAVQTVSDSAVLWDTNSVCYLSYIADHSSLGETTYLDTVPNPWGSQFPPAWRLNVQGYKALGGGARCAWLGRPVGAISQFSVGEGGSVATGMSTSLGVCFIQKVAGNLDDGGVRLNQSGGFWTLETWGQVSAGAYCITYN